MRMWFLLAALLSFHNPAFSSTDDRSLYYIGLEVRKSTRDNSQFDEELVLKKSYSPSQNLLSEIACVKKAGSPAELSPVYMKVDGNLITDISTDSGFATGPLSGTGQLKGDSWNWDYLEFSMRFETARGNVRIEDKNWVVGHQIKAEKQIYWRGTEDSSETQISLIQASVDEVNESDFNAKWTALGCP